MRHFSITRCFHSKGLLAGHCPTLAFTPLREFILRLWRGPSPRTYSWGTVRHLLSYRRRLTICLLFSQSLRRCAGDLLRGRFGAPIGDCISLWRCSRRSGRCRLLWVYHRQGRFLCRRLWRGWLPVLSGWFPRTC